MRPTVRAPGVERTDADPDEAADNGSLEEGFTSLTQDNRILSSCTFLVTNTGFFDLLLLIPPLASLSLIIMFKKRILEMEEN